MNKTSSYGEDLLEPKVEELAVSHEDFATYRQLFEQLTNQLLNDDVKVMVLEEVNDPDTMLTVTISLTQRTFSVSMARFAMADQTMQTITSTVVGTHDDLH